MVLISRVHLLVLLFPLNAITAFHVSSYETRRTRQRCLEARDGIKVETTMEARDWLISPWNVTILSKDPKVYYIENLLSSEECRSYIQWAKMRASEDGGNKMSRSNPPSISLDLTRLWPLPILCLLAGIPSSLYFIDKNSPSYDIKWISNLLLAVLPAFSIATAVTVGLCMLTLIFVRSISDESSRTSEAVSLNSLEDCDFIRPLVERVFMITGHSWEKFEAPVVTRYRTGARFASHNDASPNKGVEWSDLGGQRVITVITYLNTCLHGGGTKFDRLGFTVQPVKGSALVFYPADSQTLVADERTVHQSLPAVEEKWIVQMFGRRARVPWDLGIPDSFKN